VNEGVNFTPRGQISPLGAKFTPRGEVHPWGPGVKLRMALRVARWFIFMPKNSNLGIFWRALEWTMFEYIISIWNIYAILTYSLVYIYWYNMYVVIRYIFPRFDKKNINFPAKKHS
jgi:hypothetical protein